MNKKDDLDKQFKLNKINTEAKLNNHTSNDILDHNITTNDYKKGVTDDTSKLTNNKTRINRMNNIDFKNSF